MGARIYKNYDPSVHKSIKVKKLYNSKAALLPMFFIVT